MTKLINIPGQSEPNMVSNPIKEAHETSISGLELGKAMAQLDLTSVPEHRRQEAILDHFFKVMTASVTDPQLRTELAGSRILRKGKVKL
jgi:uncharacterized membrane-anchored protein YjiN (DUF445 family)